MGSGKRKTYLLCLFYYKIRINKHFLGANQLSKFLDIGLYSAQYITKFIKSSSYLAIVYKDFIISFRPDSSEVLATSWNLFPVKKTEIKNTNSKISKSVYGFNHSTSEYKTWPSISECTKFFFQEGKLKILELLKRE